MNAIFVKRQLTQQLVLCLLFCHLYLLFFSIVIIKPNWAKFEKPQKGQKRNENNENK